MKRTLIVVALLLGVASPAAAQYVAVQGNWYEASAPNRPGCFVEPSLNVDGFEVILYPDISRRWPGAAGFEVPCPG